MTDAQIKNKFRLELMDELNKLDFIGYELADFDWLRAESDSVVLKVRNCYQILMKTEQNLRQELHEVSDANIPDMRAFVEDGERYPGAYEIAYILKELHSLNLCTGFTSDVKVYD